MISKKYFLFFSTERNRIDLVRKMYDLMAENEKRMLSVVTNVDSSIRTVIEEMK